YYGDEYLAQKDFFGKIKMEYLEVMFGDQLSDEEKWYRFIGHEMQMELYRKYFKEVSEIRNKMEREGKLPTIKKPEPYH
ncbi:MAG: hypothetical protein ACE5H1_06845, partial [Thermodesulfobacteriota bacterium]